MMEREPHTLENSSNSQIIEGILEVLEPEGWRDIMAEDVHKAEAKNMWSIMKTYRRSRKIRKKIQSLMRHNHQLLRKQQSILQLLS